MLPFRFYLITDRLRSSVDTLALLPDLVGGGLRALQVREKDLHPAALYAYCLRLRGVLPAPCQLYLNDRADIALSLAFSGVHLREESLPLASHAPPLRSALSFGVSTHSLAGVQAAAAAGADFATFGPIYPTPSKGGAALGLRALERVAAASPLPLLALGGVTPQRARECLSAGAQGVAGISAIWDAPHPLNALAAFADALGGL